MPTQVELCTSASTQADYLVSLGTGIFKEEPDCAYLFDPSSLADHSMLSGGLSDGALRSWAKNSQQRACRIRNPSMNQPDTTIVSSRSWARPCCRALSALPLAAAAVRTHRQPDGKEMRRTIAHPSRRRREPPSPPAQPVVHGGSSSYCAEGVADDQPAPPGRIHGRDRPRQIVARRDGTCAQVGVTCVGLRSNLVRRALCSAGPGLLRERGG